MKFYFISSILFSIFITLLAISDSYFIRMIFLIPVIILFFLTFLLFAYEYDKQNIVAWKKKEEKLKEKIYLDFFSKYKKIIK